MFWKHHHKHSRMCSDFFFFFFFTQDMLISACANKRRVQKHVHTTAVQVLPDICVGSYTRCILFCSMSSVLFFQHALVGMNECYIFKDESWLKDWQVWKSWNYTVSSGGGHMDGNTGGGGGLQVQSTKQNRKSNSSEFLWILVISWHIFPEAVYCQMQ